MDTVEQRLARIDIHPFRRKDDSGDIVTLPHHNLAIEPQRHSLALAAGEIIDQPVRLQRYNPR